MKYLILFLLPFLFSSCAGVKIYKDENLSEETAIKVHLPKPFLLVERNPAKDVAVKATIVYLPDQSDSLYIKPKNGWGSSDVQLNLEKGYLSQFGAISDSKGPETITAITGGAAGILGGVASLITATKEDVAAAEEKGDNKAFEALKVRLENIKTNLSGADETEMTSNQKNDKKSIIKKLEEAIGKADEGVKANVEPIAKLLTESLELFENLIFKSAQTEPKKKHNEVHEQLKEELKNAKEKFTPKPVVPTIELFEILYDVKKGKYYLKSIDHALS